jgi:hypothetical protein
MRNRFEKLTEALVRMIKLDRALDEIKINQGRMLTAVEANTRKPRQLCDREFKIFSQWGEDGIIQFLIANLAIRHRTFIEFGVEDFFEANCRFLLMKDNWSGYVIDGSPSNIERLRSSYFYWRYPLQSKAAFITRENIDALLAESGFDREPGILSVDIDGVDYYVLEALRDWRPSILIVEYNAVFGSRRAVTVPYDPQFQRTRRHHSNLYYGASLPAFLSLANERGYALVGVNSVGSNAFFVRRDLLNDVVCEVDAAACFRDSTFRESRDAQAELTFLSGNDRRRVIADMPLIDVQSGESLYVRDLAD